MWWLAAIVLLFRRGALANPPGQHYRKEIQRAIDDWAFRFAVASLAASRFAPP